MTRLRRGLGLKGENMAAAYLWGKGYTIVERNFRCRLGEIDIIARQGDYLVFVEVRTRHDTGHGLAQESITRSKIERLRRLASYYLALKNQPDIYARFDVVAVNIAGKAEITHIENAF